MAFYRILDDGGACHAAGKKVLIAANFGKEPANLPLEYQVKRTLLSNLPENHVSETLKLAGCGVMVLECV